MCSSIIGAGTYRYTQDLLRLDEASRREVPLHNPQLQGVSSPLSARWERWREGLRAHPDKAFVGYILSGLQHGFRVGFDYTCPLHPARQNMQSAKHHPTVIDEYVQGEQVQGRILGPFSPGAVPGCHVNRMGVIPKGHTPGKWRLITDLSFPDSGNVNGGIDSALCSLQYTSVENISLALRSLGKGALLAKVDVKAAYRLIPVHPEDRPLLGIEWKGAQYVDAMLPFGLCSAPKIFTAVADGLEWILRQRGIKHIHHYLDDYITFGPAGSLECAKALELIQKTCSELGVPLAMEKLEGPTTCLTFLGIEVDTVAGTLRLPQDKLSRLRKNLAEWERRKSCKKRDLESLVGTLQHACRVVRPGRSFLRRMIDLLCIPKRTYHHIRLNGEFRADVWWWSTFAAHWNGVAIFPPPSVPMVLVTSDASGEWGCGAWSQQAWFQFQWPAVSRGHHIAFKELFAILLACVVWGSKWQGCRVHARCDNQAAVHAITGRSCKDKSMMHLLRCLFFCEARYECRLSAVYLPGVLNTLADDLSRDRRSSFLSKAPGMDKVPSPAPPGLPELLLGVGDWTSPSWIATFNSSLFAASPIPPGGRISPV